MIARLDPLLRYELKGEGNYRELEKQKKELEELGHQVVLEATAWVQTRVGKFPSKGRLYIYRQIDNLEYARPSDETDKVINRGRVSDLKVDMENLIKDGWYLKGEIQEGKYVKPAQIQIDVDYLASTVRTVAAAAKLIVDTQGAYEDGSPKSGRLIVNRKGIASGYCNIPLKFMVEHARKHSILIRGKLDKRIKIILDEVPMLNDVEAALRKYMSQKGLTGSRPGDWNDINKAKTWYPDIKTLRNKHLHMSSSFNYPVIDPGFTPRFEGNLRRRFYYDG